MTKLNSLIVLGLRSRSEVARIIDKLLSLLGLQRRYYSSKRQDYWAIETVFRGKRNGYFVEIGAGDGRTHSNTFILEKAYGWSGILVEANPNYFAPMLRYRSCHCENTCIDSTADMVDFFCFGHLGGIIGADTDNCPSHRSDLLRRFASNIVSVKCKPFQEILRKWKAPSKIDFLSIDVEGAELRVLEEFPFDRYMFNAVVIERSTKPIHKIMTSKGYVLERVYRNDGFYLSAEKAAQLGVRGVTYEGSDRKSF